MYEGFSTVLVPPSPKSQVHETGVFDDVSVNWTVNGVVPDKEVSVKDATGAVAVAAFTVIALLCTLWVLPPALVAVRVTVYVPAVVYV